MSNIIFSCIIPASAKDLDSQKLKDLISSIKAQDFPQDQIEILVISPPIQIGEWIERTQRESDGAKYIFNHDDSEQAKATGIREAKGEICAMFCADNILTSDQVFKFVHHLLSRLDLTGAYSRHYDVARKDNSLNRYFSLIGGNDPICYYLGKNDRKPYFERLPYEVNWENVCLPHSNMKLPSLGDNGFFVKRHILLESADLDHYYPMDVYVDINKKKMLNFARISKNYIWHRTSDNLITFLIKRYKYARDLYSNRSDRRWKMVDGAEDYWRLFCFIFFTLTLVQPIWVSIRGFVKIRDWAWFLHLPVCWGFLFTYTSLTVRTFLYRLLYLRLGVSNPFKPLSKA